MNKVEMVKTELNYIKNSRIKKSTEIFVNMLPDYFFTTAASSTGKYHPAFAAGEGGLLRHSKAAAYILNEIISTKTFYHISLWLNRGRFMKKYILALDQGTTSSRAKSRS